MNVMQSYHMQTMIREGDVVVDVGANLGSYLGCQNMMLKTIHR